MVLYIYIYILLRFLEPHAFNRQWSQDSYSIVIHVDSPFPFVQWDNWGVRCDDLIARFAYIIFSSFRPDSSFCLIIPEVNLSQVCLRCEVGPHGGQRVRRRCEETIRRRALVPKRALNPTCAASSIVHLAVRDYRLELPMILSRACLVNRLSLF